MKHITTTCNTLEEVKAATSLLDSASCVPLKIDDGGIIKDVTNFKGIYNIIGGNKESLEIWNNNLPYCCDYCLFKREIEMPNG